MAGLGLSLIIFMRIYFLGVVQGRLIRLNTSNHDQLITDGLNANQSSSPFDLLDYGLAESSSGGCKHDYGFLPCADNIGGHIFELVLFQYLLFVGGKCVTNGSKKLFTMLGTGIFGASIFRVLLSLPRIVYVIVSGIESTKEGAQQQVSLGVAIYAGSTVLSLTVLWAMCVIAGKRDLPGRSRVDSSSQCVFIKQKLSDLNGKGVITDKKTSYTAGIMLLSLIPYGILQLVNVFTTYSARRLVMLIALVVSTLLLLAYFLYQIFFPWIQKRSLEYSRYEKLVTEFWVYAQKRTQGKLVYENGQPNIPAMERLFNEADKDGDKSLTIQELEKLLDEIDSGKAKGDENYALSQMIRSFDHSSDGKISFGEFVEGAKKWISDAKQLAGNGNTTRKFLTQVVESFTQTKTDELNRIEELTGKILKRIQFQTLDWFLNPDGSVNTDRITAAFNQFDTDGNNSISREELQKLIGSEQFGGEEADDGRVEEWMKEFDKDGDNMISEEEFISAVKRLVKEGTGNKTSDDDKINWGGVDKKLFDKLSHDKTIKGTLLAAWALSKPIAEIMLGVLMLTFLAKPFASSLLQISSAMGMSTFAISFIIVPLITNAKTAIAAIFPARGKSEETASLTFSELYGDVIMNNIMGVTTLLVIISAKDLTWNYSAEVLIIFIVCGIAGILSFLCTTYHLWCCFLAIFMYFLSIALYYVLQYFWGWH